MGRLPGHQDRTEMWDNGNVTPPAVWPQMTVAVPECCFQCGLASQFRALEGKNRVQNPTRLLARIPILVKPTNSVCGHVRAPSPAAPSIRSRNKKWKKPPD
jgi:hypothetical protein